MKRIPFSASRSLNVTHAIVLGLIGAGIGAACSSESDGNNNGNLGPTPSATSGAPAVSSAPIATSAAIPSGMPSGTPSGMDTSMPSATDTAPPPPACTTTGYTAESEGIAFPGIVQAFANTDTGGSTACLAVEATQTCISGRVTTAGDSYENWGAQIGFQLVETDDMGVAIGAPFDAAAKGITGFKFTLTGVGTGGSGKPPKVRLQVAMVSTDEFEFQSYGYPLLEEGDDGYEQDYTADQLAVTVTFDQLGAPKWALDLAADAMVTIPPEIDPARIYAVVLQTATDQTNTHDYNVCLSSFEWLDANGMPVTVMSPEPVGSSTAPMPSDTAAMPSSSDTAAMPSSSDTAPMMSASASAMPSMSASAMPPDADALWAAAWAVLGPKCAACHTSTVASGGLGLMIGDEATSRMNVETKAKADECVATVKKMPGQPEFMPLGANMQLPANEIKALEDWAASLQ